MIPPFLTIYTPTSRRPRQLAACLASVARQTAIDRIEHLIVADHVGRGIGAMFARIAWYADAVHGEYVYVLADDDVLDTPTVVDEVYRIICKADRPPVVIARACKGGHVWPTDPPWPPREGAIDLGCLVTRADIWRRHVGEYGARYEGDYDFAAALARMAYPVLLTDCLLSRGPVSRGAIERAA